MTQLIWMIRELLYFGFDKKIVAMGEVHEGSCGTHQSASKMKRLLRRANFYYLLWWLIAFVTTKDAKSVKSLGIFSLCLLLYFIHYQTMAFLWLGTWFHWLNIVKGHYFMLVVAAYFTNWTEIVPLKNITQKEIIVFIIEHTIHRFGIHQH